jgi:biopolymer transport protein ExbB
MTKTNSLTALATVLFVALSPLASVGIPAALAQTAPAPAPTAAPAATAPVAPAPAAAPGAAPADQSAAPTAAAPAASDVPAAPAVGPAPTTEAVDNPYGLDALWKGGDFVSRGTLIILVIMSVGTWYIMITKVWEQSRLFSAGRSANKSFWTAGSIQESVGKLKPTSPFRYIAESGVSASEHHEGTLVEQIDLNTWVTMSMQRAVEAIQSRLQGGLAFLATVGSTAPFVGLFGTVWGIYHALTAIGIAGQASIDKVAGPVGEALIMTAIGLATAVPAVLGYNWLVRRNKSGMEMVRNFSSDVHSVLLSGSNPSKGATARVA